MTVVDPSCPAMRWAVASLSPLSMTTSHPASCSAATAAAEVSRTASARPITATARPSTATSTAVRPAAGQLVAPGGQRPELDALVGHQPGVADQHATAGDGGTGAAAGDVAESLGEQ